MESLFRKLLWDYFSPLPSALVTLLKEKESLNLSLPELLIGGEGKWSYMGPHTIKTGTRSLLESRDSRQKNVTVSPRLHVLSHLILSSSPRLFSAERRHGGVWSGNRAFESRTPGFTHGSAMAQVYDAGPVLLYFSEPQVLQLLERG